MIPHAVYMTEGIVRLIVSGPLALADYRRLTEEALQLARSKNVELFLVDDQQTKNRASTLELFSLPAMYEELGVPRSSKVAIVVAQDTRFEPDLRFFETVCVNRGWNVRVFTAERQAIEWLLVKK